MNVQLEASEAFTFEISCILEASLTLVNFYFLKLGDSFYLSQNYGHISFFKSIIVTPELIFFPKRSQFTLTSSAPSLYLLSHLTEKPFMIGSKQIPQIETIANTPSTFKGLEVLLILHEIFIQYVPCFQLQRLRFGLDSCISSVLLQSTELVT